MIVREGLLAAAAATMLFASAGSTAAQSVPRYDPERYCREVSETVGGSAIIFNTCVEQEQSSYDKLKRSISSLPARTVSYCDDVASAVGGTYQILETCIDQEVGAAASAPRFRF